MNTTLTLIGLFFRDTIRFNTFKNVTILQYRAEITIALAQLLTF